MNRPGAVHGNQIDEPAFEQIDQLPLDARPEHMRADRQNPSRPGCPCREQSLGEERDCRMLKLTRRVEWQEVVERQIMMSIGERPNPQARAVELRIWHGSSLSNQLRE